MKVFAHNGEIIIQHGYRKHIIYSTWWVIVWVCWPLVWKGNCVRASWRT